MIEILHKEDCCGCEACRQCCPHKCISMKKDEEGFLYPIIDKTKCVECGLCERVCPVLNPYDEHLPLSVNTFTHSDESIRMNSSSGGFFTKIAAAIIEQGGVVFGACFDDEWRVVHTYIDKKEKLSLLQGSKYVQSSIGDSYISAKRFLQDGVPVLFTGTSCQIAGLKRFLRKDYDLLYTMDVICHGVPSPLVWKDYLHSISSVSDIESISFRNKSTGWKNYSFSLKHNCLNFEVISEILFSDGSSLLIDNAKSFQALLKNNSSMIVIFSDLKSLVYFLKKSRFSVSKMIFVGVFMFDCRQVNVFLDIESTITTTNL